MKKNTLHLIGILMILAGYICAEEIKPGEYISGVITGGKGDALTFNANAGDVVSVLMGDINDDYSGSNIFGFYPQVELIEPNGVRTWEWGYNSAAINAKKISQSGPHMIIAREYHGNRSGAYGLSMIKNPGTDVNDPEDDPVPILSSRTLWQMPW